MKTTFYLIISLFSLSQSINGQESLKAYEPKDMEIYNTISLMDSIFFDAYNNCNMEKQKELYADNIEFFHDKSGLSTSKTEILEATKNNICGKVTRTLIPGSIEVYPINNYGAVEIGHHKFFNNQEPGALSSPSKFIIIWQFEKEEWKITKVISLH